MKASINHKREKYGENQIKRTFLSPELQLVLFAVIMVLIFFLLFHFVYKMQYTGTLLYFDFASKVFHGGLPYRDFNFEYPPFALFFFILPRLFTSTYKTFVNYYHFEVFIFILIGLFVIYYIARRLGKAPWKMLAVYTIAILAIGPIVAEQYDIFPAILTLLSVYFFWLGKHKVSWVLIALGTMTKIYPVVIAPIFLIYYIRNRQYRRIWSGIVIFAAISLAVVLPFLIISLDSIWALVNYHSQRGIQIESTYGAFLLLADKLGLTSVNVIYGFGSWNLSSPLADALAKLSTYLLVILLIIAYWFIYNQMRPGKSQFTRLGAYSLLSITITLIASKVLSPQYLIWLTPLIPLIFGPLRYTIMVVFVAMGGLTYIILPLHYLDLLRLDPAITTILFLRDILLILLAVLAWVSLRRMKASS